MKKTNPKWKIRTTALALTAACLCAGVAVAAGGGQSDPLVTLSYLTQTATPDILRQVEDQGAKQQAKLTEQFNQAIDSFRQQGQTPTGGQSASFQVITLKKGQTLQLGMGCEVMLRVGSATVSAQTPPALVDMTTGGELNSGGALTANHLYLATMSDRTVKATAETVKLMVRGSYTLN